MDPFVGEIRMLGFKFAPKGWALCDGQLMPVSQYTVLFSILRTRFGGNGQTNFALPDLRRRVPMGQGDGPGLSPRQLGDAGGENHVDLTVNQIPAHRHAMQYSPGPFGRSSADSKQAKDNTFGQGGGDAYSPSGNAGEMAEGALSSTGQGMAHENRQPYLTVNFCIALKGTYPPPST